MNSKLIIGLTGGIGSGKTAATDHFKSLGIDIVDADVIAREIVNPGSPTLKAVAVAFGDEILLPDGNLNRAKLRELIFSDNDAKATLNAIMQPAIREQLLLALDSANSPYVILSAPLLLENGLEQYCDLVVVVDVPENLQIERASKRDDVSKEQVKSIINSQIERSARLQKATDVIDNSKDLDFLFKQVVKLHNKYLTQAVG